MAKKHYRPGRTLGMFFLGVAIAYALVALTGTWKPQLGLDLQGGTRITLQAKGSPSKANLNEARDIIDARVNGSGISEAEVNTEGGNVIAVEIPGKESRDLVETVQRQAQLRFRLVACPAPGTAACSGSLGGPTTTPGSGPTAPLAPTATAPAGDKGAKGDKKGSKPSGNNRPAAVFGDDSATESPSDSPSTAPTGQPTDQPTGTPAPGGEEPQFSESYTASLDDENTWAQAPDAASVAKWQSYTCSDKGLLLDGQTGEPADLPDDPTKPLIACSSPDDDSASATPYLLSKAIIEGTDLKKAGYGIPQNQVNYVVNLELEDKGKDVFSKASSLLVGSERQFAMVLDGQVISAPTFDGVIQDGSAQISGNFNEGSAKSLSTSLKYGSLPISFESSVDVIGPSLAGDQLSAGITAGIAGLALVMIYCLFYYRGLGLVVLSSLLMAGVITYAAVLLLSESAGFTLTLPGIAGLIIAVGITADSFIILFERIRDEMRDGKSMRVSVESGWVKARNTTLAADGVSLLAAIVLYIFAAGVVRGFAFALGLSTVIDLAVFFWFTKPLMSTLGRFTFFNSGHRFSGLSAETLGVDAITPHVAGGKA